jgi:hypothetical protein
LIVFINESNNRRSKRGEATMVRPGDTCSSISRLIRQYRSAAFIGGLACGLVVAAAPMVAEELPASEVPQIATAAPETPETSGATATPAAVSIVKPVDAQSEQQRRVLMLLLMNSGGPVRPFGNLGH